MLLRVFIGFSWGSNSTPTSTSFVVTFHASPGFEFAANVQGSGCISMLLSQYLSQITLGQRCTHCFWNPSNSHELSWNRAFGGLSDCPQGEVNLKSYSTAFWARFIHSLGRIGVYIYIYTLLSPLGSFSTLKLYILIWNSNFEYLNFSIIWK